MIAGQLEIQLLANMARLQSDMDNAKRTVSSAVDGMNKVLATIGVGISVAGIANMVKSVADAGDKLNDLSKITGLTVNELGGLEKQAKLNGTTMDAVAKAVGQMSKQLYNDADAFKALGIATREADGSLRNANQVLLDVSDRFSKIQDGAAKSAIANQIFGKSGRELIPLLNEGSQKLIEAANAHQKYSGWTNESAEQADLFNDQLTILQGRIAGVKTRLIADLLPGINNIISAFVGATDQVNQFSLSSNILLPILKGIAIAGYTVADTFNGIARSIGAAIAQAGAIAKFDYGQYFAIEAELNRLNAESRQSYNKFVDTVLNGNKTLEDAAQANKKLAGTETLLPPVIDKTVQAMEKKNKAFNMELYKLKEYEKEAARARDITESVRTKQEIFNDSLDELNRLKPYLSIEAYTRKLEQLQRELNDTGEKNRQVVHEMDQLWIQAGRNIQNALGNMVFDFFNGGLDDMVRNVKNAVLRIVSEFAGLKIAQTLGITSLFAIPGMAGASTGAASSGLGLGSLLNIGSMGTSLMSMVNSGFGSLGVIGSAIGGLGSLTGSSGLAAFGGGLAGDAIGGLAAGGFTSGAASAASMGSAFAAAAGPLMAAFLTTQVAKMIAGDKRMGGGFGKALNAIGDIPVLGDFMAIVPVLNALFGRGPYKFRQQSLQGTATAGGFEGSITDVYRSKGGLFMGNKHKEFTNPLDNQMNQMFDQAIRAYSTSVRDFSENMGISTSIIDNWSKEVQIKSEKGKRLTEEAVAQLIASFGDEMARSVIPGIEQLSKAGESAYQTLQRLNSEFESLTNAATILGYSLAESSEIIKQMSYEQRTAFIDLFGGLDSFNQQISFFMQNFLTPAERLAPMAEALGNELNKLGIVSSLTNDQFKALIQSYGAINGINQAQFLGLMALQDEVLAVNKLREQVIDTTDGLVASESSLVSLRQQLLVAYNKERGELEASVSKFESISRTLRDFRDSLALSELSPLTPEQQLAEAARQFNLVRTQAAAGDQDAMAKLPTVAEQFLRASQTYNASSAAYISDFNLVQSVLANTADVALSQADIARQQLTQLQKSVTGIIDISDNTKTTNELLQQILEIQQQLGETAGGTTGGTTGGTGGLDSILQQLASMQASGSSNIDLYNYARSNNLTAEQASSAVSGYTAEDINAWASLNSLQPLTGSSTGSLFTNTATDEQIKAFLATNPEPMLIYEKAREFNVSSARLANLMEIPQQQILDWVTANGLAAFETGTDYVPRTGIALLHKGEAVQPATMGDEIKALRAEIAEFRREQAKLMMDQNNVIAITNKQNAEVIVNSAKDTSRNENWHKQTTARMK